MKTLIYAPLALNIIMCVLSFLTKLTLGDSLTLSQNSYWTLLALLIVIGAAGIITGLSVLGSGLNETSTRIVLLLLFFNGIWFVFSTYTYDLLSDVPLYLGGIFYWILFGIFLIGQMWTVSKGGL